MPLLFIIYLNILMIFIQYCLEPFCVFDKFFEYVTLFFASLLFRVVL